MATEQKSIRSIRSKAPTRIDLAGGTIDLWPLYLFLERPVTINLAIDLFAEAELEFSPTGKNEAKITLLSEDQKVQSEYEWKQLPYFSGLAWANTTKPHPALELHLKLLNHFVELRAQAGAKEFDFNLTLKTRAKSPAGAGLGGSSTLSVAIIGALSTWVKGVPIEPQTEGVALVEIVRDIETTVIQVPAGVQDYYGAMFGGLQSLKWRPGTHERSHLPALILPELEKRLLLFYSGQSRNSGINNWALFKAFIDKHEGVREKFERISRATQKLELALKARDWTAVGQAIGEEWETRRTLAPGITTPEIDRAFAQAKEVAPISGKVCGAGGGGCFFVYVPSGDDDAKARIQHAFSSQGIRPLPFHAVPHGVDVQVSRA